MASMLREVIKAIEEGQRFEDHRGIVYRQEFGQAFLDALKAAADEIERLRAIVDEPCDY